MLSLKLVVNGDAAVGKTSMNIAYTSNSFPNKTPVIYDAYSANVMCDGMPVNLGLWDATGSEDYDRLRPLSYPQTDVFLTLFSVSNRRSFENVKTRWIPEITHHCPYTPHLLVGTKVDLRRKYENGELTEDEFNESEASMKFGFSADKAAARIRVLRKLGDFDFVSFVEGVQMAKDVGAYSYVEISALEGVGLNELFDEAIVCAIFCNERARRRELRRQESSCILQ